MLYTDADALLFIYISIKDFRQLYEYNLDNK